MTPLELERVLKNARARQGLRGFLEEVTINCRPLPKPFKDVADPWQWDQVLEPLIPAIEMVAGLRPGKPRYETYWYTLPKGSDKTSVIGRIGTYCCNYAINHVGICVWAKDKDQAKLLRDAMIEEQRLNLWWPQSFTIDNYKATGLTGWLEIKSSDTSGGHGTRPHIMVCDELSVWDDRSVWDMICSSSGKYEDIILIILCNAGWKGTWQHDLRNKFKEEFEKGGKTYFWEPNGIQASWTNREKVERIRQKIVPSEGRRLYDNEWVDASEESAFPEELINAMFCLTAPYDCNWPIMDS